MNKLIKKQDEEFSKIVIADLFDRGLSEIDAIHAKQEFETFISKVRKETAEMVCDKMIGETSFFKKITGFETSELEQDKQEGYDERVKEEKQLKNQILKELK